MAVILFKSMDTAYLKMINGASVQNTAVDKITITMFFDNKVLMNRNSDKLLAFIDESNKVLYDIYKSELASFSKVAGGWLAKINAQIFKRFSYSGIVDKDVTAGQSLTANDISNLQYLFVIVDKQIKGAYGANVSINSKTYTMTTKIQGNSVSKMYRAIVNGQDGFEDAQFPAGRNDFSTTSSATQTQFPEFVSLGDAQAGFTFQNTCHMVYIK